MEVDIALLEEGEEGSYFLVVGNMLYEGNEGIPHGHMVGIGFSNEADWRLGVDGMVWGGCKARVLEGCV